MAFKVSLLSLSLLSSIHLSNAAAVLPIERRALQLSSVPVAAFQAPSADVATDNFLPLTKLQSNSITTLDAVRRELSAADLHKFPKRQSAAGTAPLTSLGGIEYLVDITFGTQNVKVILDTGSSDTWLIQKGFKCTDANGASQSTATCNFGPAYTGTITQTANENFQISYGDGEFVTGIIGTQDVTIAGITVPKQTVSDPITRAMILYNAQSGCSRYFSVLERERRLERSLGPRIPIHNIRFLRHQSICRHPKHPDPIRPDLHHDVQARSLRPNFLPRHPA